MIKLPLGAAYPTSPFVLLVNTEHNKCCNILHDTDTFNYTLFLLKIKNFVAHKMVIFPLGFFVNLFTD